VRECVSEASVSADLLIDASGEEYKAVPVMFTKSLFKVVKVQ
jgi:hypothetical protein